MDNWYETECRLWSPLEPVMKVEKYSKELQTRMLSEDATNCTRWKHQRVFTIEAAFGIWSRITWQMVKIGLREEK